MAIIRTIITKNKSKYIKNKKLEILSDRFMMESPIDGRREGVRGQTLHLYSSHVTKAFKKNIMKLNEIKDHCVGGTLEMGEMGKN